MNIYPVMKKCILGRKIAYLIDHFSKYKTVKKKSQNISRENDLMLRQGETNMVNEFP